MAMTQDPNERLRLEALALRHVLSLPVEEREDAASALAGAAFHLVATTAAVEKELPKTPNLELPDVAAMQDRRRVLNGETEALDAAGLADWASRGVDPEEAQEAFARCLADTAAARDARRRELARACLDKADAAPTAQERADLQAEAAALLRPPAQTERRTIAEDWPAFIAAAKNAEPCKPQEAIQLDAERRGEWARWFNANLGGRGGLEPGTNVFIGGSWGAGKTSLGALLAVDALAAGCPVLFWQLELNRFKTLEHMTAQLPGTGRWWLQDWKRRLAGLSDTTPPDGWERLDAPSYAVSEVSVIQRAIESLARKSDAARRAGTLNHACNGLVVVDYIQKLAKREKGARAAEHEVMNSAASDLVKTAADLGVCLAMLCQINKDAQRSGEDGGTTLAGADLARPADTLVTIRKAKKANGQWEATRDGEKPDHEALNGDARLLKFWKNRGTLGNPEPSRPVWNCNRALHGGEEVRGRGAGGA